MKPQALLEWMHPLFAGDFFSCKVEIFKKKTKLPDMSELLCQESFVQAFFSWDEESLTGSFFVKDPCGTSVFPEVFKADAIEIFIDTRDNKKAGFASKFCHHFVFLPWKVSEEGEGGFAKEITKFRSEESHPLCDPTCFSFTFSKEGYLCTFTLSKEELYGYDPLLCAKLGLAYRVHRGKGKLQSFPFSAKSFEPLHHPSLWASLILK